MYMVMFVLDNLNLLDELLTAWEEVGIRGVTIVESTGIHRRRRQILPMRYMFQATSNVEESHYTLFAIVDSQNLMRDCLDATEKLVGDLDQPDTGVFSAWPLSLVKGLPSEQESE